MTKTAVVTGAARGIGRALAVGLAEAGYDVAVTDLAAQADGLAETRALIEAAGRRAFVETVDVSDRAAVVAAMARIEDAAGGIDVLVNNAGILKPARLEDLSEADWDAHMDVNVKGVLSCCQAVLPGMRARKAGRIVNIASIAGRQGVPTQGHYAATKAAVITLTRVLAQEAGMDGITVNAICPGIILTEMGKNNLGSDEAIRHWEEVAALKRLGAPEDIVGPVLFFAGEQSAFVTGQALNVCGGIYFH
ncbi:SDR family oxidoreductase [Rhodobacter sphaeroides]|jgi:Dehydrogenases with different specificities (related to short-chain alcohol dehydrogenases)|uniref:3-oxoacyl-(Acyl-carrier protein) reductase / Short-chain dehydrogenase/reductase SDR n=1 Tax=Cereibacter sphaeroides (strain ATCC 17023 / DSM 158 / JCM 6121 / CCUG 31486 / LMG 2827 / NBRC 12203 / NCIMB 8253 / ATH 2.4.1.) TaxID=272943 RepID=Q3J3V5_CERS4|nr:SDR family NAD(P)-dependent oxidoreductase [Cereibacter sphaeroides]ABA78529.1 3-oxoacyl-(acyl-carrier protein) reductase / Short-chain dehydrogenase/reductase SDR [Cereibacter sphaeroides 2.4.1]AMJ46880.1 3-oxoacyl-ACP reductase [Cereibacter sphaeroides]ANS33592.1 3-oxoacyl-ACP reductase [Cereibacter sphaeroides]ATN62636.1 3-oxoacyl-ACP reductase [Cereibacter sphaeroides]AXC60749.1 SDR family NAD(P)-dependent oxidoreductase [Cereibacter sphaeroides 2.4.1]